jgi:Domain of unknown function (DUF4338)/Transposase DNA-binding/Transposase DDE domain
VEIQNQIKRALSEWGSIEIIRRLLSDSVYEYRSTFADAVCQQFGFYDARGRVQRSGCIKALRELERLGHFALPAASPMGAKGAKSARRLGAPVEDPHGVPEQAGAVRGLCLIQVDALDRMRIWNEMMLGEHPQGAGPLVGAQMRYLIGSDHGWLGGLGFGAAAIRLADRDRWIGWDGAKRREQLHRIVAMSRFLIRPSVRCHHLASRVLGMVLRRIEADFEAQYGYRPWLIESFVETERFAGTSYQAANWIEIGKTKGRGRQDRGHDNGKSVKAIYVYPLAADFRRRLGGVEPVVAGALEPAEGLEGQGWAEQEFGAAQLGDRRLSERLVHSARTLATMPGQAFSGVARGDWAAVKGYYRLIDQPDDSQVTIEAILAPHRARTVQRMKAHPTVLCIQDGTDLNYTGLAQCQGLGVMGANQTGARGSGLHLHSTLVVSSEGLPLGVLQAQFTAPAAKSDARGAREQAIEPKKTFAWIAGLRDCVKLHKELPATRQVCVMDREADFFELFDEQRKSGKVELLVRAKHDRTLLDDGRLFDAVRQSPVQSPLQIVLPRQSARAKKSKQQARTASEQRTANVELRFVPIVLRPPSDQKEKDPITLMVVHVLEPSPPPDSKPLEWFLLTTCRINSVDDAQACLSWYCLRWRIEDWHRVLKTGCRIEDLAHHSADRLERAISIKLVIAWRIMLMTLLGRACPELPAGVLLSDLELKVLQAYAQKKTLSSPPTLATQSVS